MVFNVGSPGNGPINFNIKIDPQSHLRGGMSQVELMKAASNDPLPSALAAGGGMPGSGPSLDAGLATGPDTGPGLGSLGDSGDVPWGSPIEPPIESPFGNGYGVSGPSVGPRKGPGKIPIQGGVTGGADALANDVLDEVGGDLLLGSEEDIGLALLGDGGFRVGGQGDTSVSGAANDLSNQMCDSYQAAMNMNISSDWGNRMYNTHCL